MSADNWTVCPQCTKKDNAGDLLGKLPPTMREDWELGMESDATWIMSYSCYCKVCGFRWETTDKKKVRL